MSSQKVASQKSVSRTVVVKSVDIGRCQTTTSTTSAYMVYRPRGGEGGSAAPKVGKSSEVGVRVGVRCAASVVPVQNVQSSECPGDGAEC